MKAVNSGGMTAVGREEFEAELRRLGYGAAEQYGVDECRHRNDREGAVV